MIPTCAAIFRRAAAESGGWMPNYRHGEDWIFWLKLTGHGAFVCQFADVATVHRQGDNLTGSAHDLHNAQMTLNAFLKLLDGDFGVALTGANRRRLDAAIAEKRSEEHTSELQSLMRISYAVFCLKKTYPLD